MKNPTLIVALALAVVLAAVMSLRISAKRNSFNNLVDESLKKTEGYDKKFLYLVNRLEDLLATRASFGYTGDKDPMTGKVRRVVRSIAKGKKGEKVPVEQKKAEDPVKLTAIIADDDGQYTAIVMDGDRSQSVSVGDIVRNRKVTDITEAAIIMEGDSAYYKYDIDGKKFQKRKAFAAAAEKAEGGEKSGKKEQPAEKKKPEEAGKPAEKKSE